MTKILEKPQKTYLLVEKMVSPPALALSPALLLETHGPTLSGWLFQQASACWSPNWPSAVQVNAHAASTVTSRVVLGFESSQPWHAFISVTPDLEVHMQ